MKNINELIEKFKEDQKDSIEYGKKRGNCGVTATDFWVFAQKHNFDVKKVSGRFKVDKINVSLKDLTDEEIFELEKCGYNKRDKKDLENFVKEKGIEEEIKEIPHIFNMYKNKIIDFTGYYQFVRTGMSKDLNNNRYLYENKNKNKKKKSLNP